MKTRGALLVFLLFSIVCTQDLNSIIAQVESDIISLRDAAETGFKNRCTATANCSYHICSGNPQKTTCNVDFVTAECSCFNPEGTQIAMESAGVKLADKYPPYVNENNQRVKEIVRAGQAMLPTFKALNQKNKDYKWLYFGSSNGVWTEYPSVCVPTYDNR